MLGLVVPLFVIEQRSLAAGGRSEGSLPKRHLIAIQVGGSQLMYTCTIADNPLRGNGRRTTWKDNPLRGHGRT